MRKYTLDPMQSFYTDEDDQRSPSLYTPCSAASSCDGMCGTAECL